MEKNLSQAQLGNWANLRKTNKLVCREAEKSVYKMCMQLRVGKGKANGFENYS